MFFDPTKAIFFKAPSPSHIGEKHYRQADTDKNTNQDCHPFTYDALWIDRFFDCCSSRNNSTPMLVRYQSDYLKKRVFRPDFGRSLVHIGAGYYRKGDRAKRGYNTFLQSRIFSFSNEDKK